MSCIDDESLAAWIGSQITEPEREAAILHAGECARCRAVIAELVGEGGQTALLGRYRIDGPLSSGGMGVVQRGTDLVLGRAVAIKMIRASLSAPEYREHFLREAQAMAQLSHPNVVAVHDFGEIGDEVFIVMELLEGVTLQRWAATHGKREVRRALIGVGRGLAAIHDRGLVHRDIKPDNIIVREDGTAVIVDFGLAGAVTIFAGTPRYIAPEVGAGEPADARSDQYAWWRVVEECLHVRSRRGLSRDPAKRYPTVSVAVDALARRRRWPLLVLALPLLVALRSHAGDPCALETPSLSGVQRVQIAAGLRAAGANDRALGVIDARAREIEFERPKACRAALATDLSTRTNGLRSELCLDQTWHRVDALFEELGSPQRELVRRALDNLAAVPPNERCASSNVGVARPPPAIQVPIVRALETALSVEQNLEPLRGPIVELGFGPLVERWRFEHARALASVGKPAEADREYQTVIDEAESLGDDEMRARALVSRFGLAYVRGDPNLGAIEREAEGAVTRAASPDLLVSFDRQRAFAKLLAGDAADAVKRLHEAITAYESIAIDAHFTGASLYDSLAVALQQTGDFASAQTAVGHRLDLTMRRWGDNAPETWIARGAVATNRMYLGDVATANAELDRIATALGSSRELVQLEGLACQTALDLELDAKRCDVALSVGESTISADDPQLIWLLDGVGEERLAMHDARGALVVLQHAAKLLVERGGFSELDPVNTYGLLAIALARSGERRSARHYAALVLGRLNSERLDHELDELR